MIIEIRLPAPVRRRIQFLLNPLLAAVTVALLATGCAQLPWQKPPAAAAPTDQPATEQDQAAADTGDDSISVEALPKQELTPQILYQLLLAEIANQRGNTGLALKAYLDLAQSTRDPRIARRAAELAMFARQQDAALEAAKLWVDIDPQSLQARQMLAGILAASGRLDELEPQIAELLRQEGPRLGDSLLRLNRLFARQSDKVAVMQLIDRLTEPYLDKPEAHLARAQAAQGTGDNKRAIAEADEALAQRSDWDLAVLFKAQVQQIDSSAVALETLRQYLRGHPKAREVRMHYARGLAAERKYPEARTEFQRLLSDFPDNPDVILAVAVLSMQLNDYALAEANFKKLLNLKQGDANLARLYLGQLAEERKNLDEALKWYGAVGAGEQYLSAQIRYANVLGRQGKLDEARSHLQSLAEGEGRDRIPLLLAEAQILREAGKTQEAYDLLDSNLSAQPNQPDLLYETALLAEKLGRMDVLETNLRKLIELKPDNAHAYNALGYSLADRSMRLDEAQQLVTTALQLAPDDAFIVDSMGWVLYRKGDLAGALQHLQRAFKLRQDPEIAAHLGEVLWMLGRHDEAGKTWRDAAKANPDNDVLAEVIKKFLH